LPSARQWFASYSDRIPFIIGTSNGLPSDNLDQLATIFKQLVNGLLQSLQQKRWDLESFDLSLKSNKTLPLANSSLGRVDLLKNGKLLTSY